MCGRFSLTISPEDLMDYFSIISCPPLAPRYNIAPCQPVAIIRDDGQCRSISMARWGLVPAWAESEAIGNRLINARIETAAQKPSFRHALHRRRCLIPASGFYEWQRQGAAKQPFFIHLPDQSPMAFAGLWEHWKNPVSGQDIESCTILTTEADGATSRIHDRMPVILPPQAYEPWLSPTLEDPAKILALTRTLRGEELVIEPVSSYVNRATNEGAQCLARPE